MVSNQLEFKLASICSAQDLVALRPLLPYSLDQDGSANPALPES